jgi:hypothetical protein
MNVEHWCNDSGGKIQETEYTHTCPNDTGPPKYLMKWLEFNPNFHGERKFARF